MKFGEKLIQAGVIDQAQLDGALRHQEQTGQRLGEALLELGYISEHDLLHHLAKEFNTQYVSSKKLAGIAVDPALLELIPVKLAEAHQIFPILLDREADQLGVVSCEPQGFEGLEEARIVSGMEKVRVYVAQRDAVRALIKKHYQGDVHAFDMLDKEKQDKFDETMEMFIDPSLEESIQVEDRAEPLSSGPAVSKPEGASQVTSSWTRAIEEVRKGSLVSDNDFIETLNILVGLIEMQIGNRQGHSARVAKAVKRVSERIGLKEHEIHYNIIAAYLHELGKRASSHLTLMSIAADQECRKLAERYCLTPSRLFDAVHLPARVNHILTHLYENYGGTGLPEQLYGEGIPLGARIISAVDAYEDLLTNPGNFFGECLDPGRALDAVKKKVGTLFDGRVVKVMEELLEGEAATQQADAARPVVLLADPENADTSNLEWKLNQEGFRVLVARDSHTARECLIEEPVAAVVVEMRLEPDDGFAVLEQVQRSGRPVPVFMGSTDAPPEAITRAFKENVADYIPKPYVADVVVAKLRKEMAITKPPPPEREARVLSMEEVEDTSDVPGLVIEVESDAEEEKEGEKREDSLPTPSSTSFTGATSKGKVLSGSLEDKTALSLVRALVGRRRTGHLGLRDGDQKGEILLEEGHVCEAVLGAIEGEEAFLELVSWIGCLYRFDPSKAPTSRSIKTPTAKLLQIAKLSRE
ncbi:HD domain-containing phosphohydrolase [Myxococcota bacterium]